MRFFKILKKWTIVVIEMLIMAMMSGISMFREFFNTFVEMGCRSHDLVMILTMKPK